MELLAIFDKSKRLLDFATSDDETPTPGYVYLEICKLTEESNEQCTKILEHLLRRLKKDSSAVKLKTLLVLRHVIQKGNSFFRRELQRRTEDIRECLYFKGPPHPLRGDAPYQLVREQAQIVVNMLFDTDPALEFQKSRSTNLPIQNTTATNIGGVANVRSDPFSRLSGVGSEQYNPLVSKYTETYRGPTGIGNVYYKPQGSSFFESIKRGLGLIEPSRPSPVYHTSNPGKLGPWSQPTIPEYQGPIETLRPMGGWDDTPAVSYSSSHIPPSPLPSRTPTQSSTTPLTQNATTVQSTSQITSPPSNAADATATTLQGNRERRLVNEITFPSGVRAIPTTAELLAFCKQCQSQESQLHLDTVFHLLLEKLSAPQWQTRLKALHVIEALLQSNVDGALAYFKNNIVTLQDQTSSIQKSITDKAKQILTMLEASKRGDTNNPSAPSDTESLSTPMTNNITDTTSHKPLVSIFDMELTSSSNIPMQKEDQHPPSMFAGLVTSDSSNSTNTPTAQTSNNDNFQLFNGLDVNNANQQTSVASSGISAPITITTTTATTAATATATIPPPPPPAAAAATTTTTAATAMKTSEAPTSKSVFEEQLANIEFDPLKATSLSLLNQQQQQQQQQQQAQRAVALQPVIVPVAGLSTQTVILAPYAIATGTTTVIPSQSQSTLYIGQPMRRLYAEKTQNKETQSFAFLDGQEEDAFDSLVKQEIQSLNKAPPTPSQSTPCPSK
jgi:hypothetical protein